MVSVESERFLPPPPSPSSSPPNEHDDDDQEQEEEDGGTNRSRSSRRFLPICSSDPILGGDLPSSGAITFTAGSASRQDSCLGLSAAAALADGKGSTGYLGATRQNSSSYSSIVRTKKEVINDPSVDVHAWKKKGNDAMECIMSALYCKILVILGFAFPLSEVISDNVPRGFYQMFYVYLFLGSLFFLCFIYVDVLRTRAKVAVSITKRRRVSWMVKIKRMVTNAVIVDTDDSDDNVSEVVDAGRVSRPKKIYGSFYIRMGALLFGMGGLIYSGIEIGVFFEVGFGGSDYQCNNVIVLVRPFLQMGFIFIQMYFIFLNHKMNIYKNKLISRFGLMHMIATNLCVWLNVLILETYHEIEELKHSNPGVEAEVGDPHHSNSHQSDHEISSHHNAHDVHHLPTPAALTRSHDNDNEVLTACFKSDVMGDILENSAPFLFPCTIEYSLICAAVLYMMWKNTFHEHEHYKSKKIRNKISFRMQIPVKMTEKELAREIARNRYSMDCSNANNGLFCGLFVMVFTIISLVVFFVLISSADKNFQTAAIQVASLTELILYSLSTLAVITGMIQVRTLWYNSAKKLELDNLLLLVAQTGVFMYSSFSIIGAYFQMEDHPAAFCASLVTLIQTTLQTVFILDASNRFAYCAEQVKSKPGRQVVTFLLVCNLSMWAMNCLETNRADSHPIQINFYGGNWVWPIITHVSMPLAIFYRYHSTVCLCEIWTKAFKYKEYMFE